LFVEQPPSQGGGFLVRVLFGMTVTPAQVAAASSSNPNVFHIIDAVLKHLKKFFDKYDKDITVKTHLAELGCDMLDRIELAMDFEQEFNVNIPDDLMEQAKDVFAIVSIISSAQHNLKNKDYAAQVSKDEADALQKLKLQTAAEAAVASTVEQKVVSDGILDVLELPAKQPWAKKSKTLAEYEESLESQAIDHTEGIKKMLADSGQLDAYVIVPADDYTIQIDLDEIADVKKFQKHHAILSKHIKLDLSNMVYTRSKSMRWHVTIKLKEAVSDLERVLIQTVLGSDIVRELMNYIGVKKEHKNPILLLERKEEWEKVTNLKVDESKAIPPATSNEPLTKLTKAEEQTAKINSNMVSGIKMPQAGVSTASVWDLTAVKVVPNKTKKVKPPYEK
jgi:acyl carrier protein